MGILQHARQGDKKENLELDQNWERWCSLVRTKGLKMTNSLGTGTRTVSPRE